MLLYKYVHFKKDRYICIYIYMYNQYITQLLTFQQTSPAIAGLGAAWPGTAAPLLPWRGPQLPRPDLDGHGLVAKDRGRDRGRKNRVDNIYVILYICMYVYILHEYISRIVNIIYRICYLWPVRSKDFVIWIWSESGYVDRKDRARVLERWSKFISSSILSQKADWN